MSQNGDEDFDPFHIGNRIRIIGTNLNVVGKVVYRDETMLRIMPQTASDRAFEYTMIDNGTNFSPELDHAERPGAQAGSLLDEEHGRAEFQAHEDRDDEQQRREADEPARREDDIERALEHQRAAGRSINCTEASCGKAPPVKVISYSSPVAQAGTMAATTV